MSSIFYYFVICTEYFLFCQLMGPKSFQKSLFIKVVSVITDQIYYRLILKIHYYWSQLLKYAQTYPEDCQFFEENQVVPYLQSSFEWKTSTKQSKQPFYEKNLWLDWQTFHFFGNTWVEILKKLFKSPADSLYKPFSHAEYFSEEIVAKNHITEHIEGFDFSKDWNQDDSRISHSLNIADVRSENVKYF